jgi:hypothetical protein
MNSGFWVTPNTVTITHKGKTSVVDSGHAKFSAIKEALKVKDFDKAVDMINLSATVNRFGMGRVTVQGGQVMFDNEPVTNDVAQHILNMITEGFDATPMVKFLENLMQNPSKRAVEELYGFIMAAKISITEDGHLLAYKKVKKRADGHLVDIHSGTFINDVGSVVEMPRNKVEDRRDITCSHGLHFCSQSYLPHFGAGDADVVVIVKINPADVVSIPSDYNNAKGRCCKYEVVEVHPYNDTTELFTKSVMTESELHETADTEYDDGYDIGYEDAMDGESNYDPSWGYAKKAGYTDGYQAGQRD